VCALRSASDNLAGVLRNISRGLTRVQLTSEAAVKVIPRRSNWSTSPLEAPTITGPSTGDNATAEICNGDARAADGNHHHALSLPNPYPVPSRSIRCVGRGVAPLGEFIEVRHGVGVAERYG
jgi:hypothetical protein